MSHLNYRYDSLESAAIIAIVEGLALFSSETGISGRCPDLIDF